ncbi:hypothetical protein QJQ45_028891, partial [Haematococcus lacustris]
MSLVAQCLRGSGPVPRSKSRFRLKARENEVRRSRGAHGGAYRLVCPRTVCVPALFVSPHCVPACQNVNCNWLQVIKVPGGAVLRGCKKTKRKLRAHFQLRAGIHSQLRVIASLYVLRIFLTCLVDYCTPGYPSAPTPPAVQPPRALDAAPLPPLPLRVPAQPASMDMDWEPEAEPEPEPEPEPGASLEPAAQEASQAAGSEPGPSTPLPAKRSKRTKAEPEAAEPSQPTKGKGKAQGKAAKAKPTPQPGRWVERDCNAALNMQRIGESKWRPLELCFWPDQGALPAKGKEYPGLGYKRLRDKPPKAQQQQPAEAHYVHAEEHPAYILLPSGISISSILIIAWHAPVSVAATHSLADFTCQAHPLHEGGSPQAPTGPTRQPGSLTGRAQALSLTGSEPGPSTPLPAKRSTRTKAEPEAAEPSQPTKGKGKAQGKAAKAKPAPQPGRWVERDCNAALNMQRIGESKWRPLELCFWPDQGALPAKGKEYPGLGYKRLRDKSPNAQQQQPAEAHSLRSRMEADTETASLDLGRSREMSIFTKRLCAPNQLATLRELESRVCVGKARPDSSSSSSKGGRTLQPTCLPLPLAPTLSTAAPPPSCPTPCCPPPHPLPYPLGLPQVLYVKDSVAIISGLNADAPLGTKLAFVTGGTGVLLWHRSDDIAFALILGGAQEVAVGTGAECKIKGVLQVLDEAKGPITKKEFELFEAPVADDMFGRLVNFLGQDLDPALHDSSSSSSPQDAGAAPRPPHSPSPAQAADPSTSGRVGPAPGSSRMRPIINNQVAMKSRDQVSEPLLTGVKAVDLLTPLGRGACLLVVGPAGSGQQQLVEDCLLGQRGTGVRCVYASTQRPLHELSALRGRLAAAGALEHCCLMAAAPQAPLGEKYAALCAALAVGERVRDRGGHCLVVLDDLQPLALLWSQLAIQGLGSLGLELPELVSYEGMLVSGAVAQRRAFFSTLFMRPAKMARSLGGRQPHGTHDGAGPPCNRGGQEVLVVGGVVLMGVVMVVVVLLQVDMAKYQTLSEEQKERMQAVLEARSALEAAHGGPQPGELDTETVEEFISIADGQLVLEGPSGSASGSEGGRRQGGVP